jgi:hypothetical protein
VDWVAQEVVALERTEQHLLLTVAMAQQTQAAVVAAVVAVAAVLLEVQAVQA